MKFGIKDLMALTAIVAYVTYVSIQLTQYLNRSDLALTHWNSRECLGTTGSILLVSFAMLLVAFSIRGR